MNRPGRLSTTHKLDVTASSAQTAPSAAQTRSVRVAVNTDCYVAMGANPTAVTTNTLMPAHSIDYLQVSPGEKLAFVRDSADGDATVTELTA